MRIHIGRAVTLQQDFYAALSDFLGEYEGELKRGRFTRTSIKGADRAKLLIRWSGILQNVMFEHLDKSIRG